VVSETAEVLDRIRGALTAQAPLGSFDVAYLLGVVDAQEAALLRVAEVIDPERGSVVRPFDAAHDWVPVPAVLRALRGVTTPRPEGFHARTKQASRD